jgi:GNAT superfamily N-acetyltransferase
MTALTIRQALIDDAGAISTLMRERIPTWQRLSADGLVESLPYEKLSVYERWTHGGPWMSIETASIALARLLHGVGLALVAERDDQIVGYLEAYPGYESNPYGEHLHLAHLLTSAKAPDFAQIGADLLARAAEVAAQLSDRLLTVSLAAAGSEEAAFYQRHGFAPLSKVGRYMLPARSGQGFYQVVEHSASGLSQIEGWQMPIGRTESASMLWEAVWVSLWEVMPELAGRKIQRVRLNASGQEMLFAAQPVPHDPRIVDLWAWGARPLSSVLLTALRDWARREGFRALRMIVDDNTAKLIASEAEADPFSRTTFALRV